jgi:TrmH family RNA methyltransferase
MAEKDNPQGILAVVRQPDRSLDQLNPHNFIWGVGLIAAQDPGNLGTILRTIDAVGASGLIIMDTSVDPYHPSAVRASMGTIFWYPPVITSFKAFISWSRTHGYQLYGTSAHAESDYRTAAYRLPGILLLGSERQGLTTEQAEVCDQLVSIPMRGRGTSLNVSIAAGVMLYAMLESMTNHS